MDNANNLMHNFCFQGDRVPADMLLLKTTEHTGATFLKTGMATKSC
jgi:hypothetical protein